MIEGISDAMLQREPARWICSYCQHVNRALNPICKGCAKQRWEQFGLSLKEAEEKAQKIYDLHHQKDVQ